MKKTNFKLNFITAGLLNFPVLRLSVLPLPVYICNCQRFYGTSSQLQLFDNYKGITSEVINKILDNQQISITLEELDKLKAIPGVKFNLPLNDETTRAFIALVGRQRSQKSGVYVFTHLKTGSKYVGSSNNLSYRLFSYFRYENNQRENSGLMLPILKEQGIAAFSLEIFVMPLEFSSGNYYLFLEQYHLLFKQFDLNTQRIVQIRALRPHNIYLYDLKGKILYYSCSSFREIKEDFGIHYETFKKCINLGNSYLNFFKITDTPIEGAIKSNLNLMELISMIAEKHKLKNRSMTFAGKRYTKSKSITMKEVITGDIKDFPNILAVVSYLESKNNKVNRNTIAK